MKASFKSWQAEEQKSWHYHHLGYSIFMIFVYCGLYIHFVTCQQIIKSTTLETKNLQTIIQKNTISDRTQQPARNQCIYLKIDMSTRLRKLRITDPIEISLANKPCSPRNHGTIAWIPGAVLLCKALFDFAWNYFFSIITYIYRELQSLSWHYLSSVIIFSLVLTVVLH